MTAVLVLLGLAVLVWVVGLGVWALNRRAPLTPAVVRPGDPFPADTSWADCPARAPGDRSYICCRDANHPMPHAAAVGLTSRGGPFVVATWPPYAELSVEESARRLGLP